MKLYKAFLEKVNAVPGNKAISDDQESLTYSELAERVKKYILDIKAPPHTCGVIYLPKSINVIAFQLALNAKNIAFLTLEWNQEQRKNECIAQSRPSLLITLIDNQVELIHLENYAIYPDNIGYIVFSSGSTGTPKQIFMKDYPIISVVKQQAKFISFTENSTFLWLLNSAFDASLSDIYVSLLNGGHLVVTQKNSLDIKHVFNLIDKNEVTHTDIPPVVFSIWLKNFKQGKINPSLKHIVFGGELANEAIVKELLQFVSLYNAYGPTETTICSSMCKIGDKWNYKDVGNPLNGVLYKIVDGELHIGGEHCAIGYNNELLNQKFYFLDGIKWFKTSDIFEEKNGSYFYTGRKDRQFKHNGQLICPEEIEHKAREYGATNSQVAYKDKKIILFYEGSFKREEFEQNIVSWMKPHLYKEIESIANNLNQNWKLKINE